MDTIKFRDALKVRESLNTEDYVFIKYRVRTDSAHDAGDLAVSVASSLVSGVSSALPWDASFGQHLTVLNLAEYDDLVTFEIALPQAVIGPRLNIPHTLAIALLPSEYAETSRVWIDDIQFPRSVLAAGSDKRMGGPALLQRLGGGKGRPLVSAIIKPRFGGDLTSLMSHAYRVLSAGVNGIVDDELMFDPDSDFSFKRRLDACFRATQRASDTSGETKYFIPNIICPIPDMATYLQSAAHSGATTVMTNSFALGYAGFEYFTTAAHDMGLAVVDCSIGATMMSYPTGDAGVSMELLTKLSRFSGADAVHTGSVGEHWYTASLLRRVMSAIRGPVPGMPPAIAVVAGGVTQANAWWKVRPHGGDCILNAGAGIWLHPDGPEYGAKHLVSALASVPLDAEEAEAHAILSGLCSKDVRFARAMDHFGYRSQ